MHVNCCNLEVQGGAGRFIHCLTAEGFIAAVQSPLPSDTLNLPNGLLGVVNVLLVSCRAPTY
jgi:hypothetical protein